MRPTRKTRFTAVVTAGVGLVVAVVVALAALLPQTTPASTAAVRVPDTNTGYTTVTASGATLSRITMATDANGTTITGAIVWLVGRNPQYVTLRFGTGTPTRCNWRGGQSEVPGSSDYQCDGLTQPTGNAAVFVEVRR